MTDEILTRARELPFKTKVRDCTRCGSTRSMQLAAKSVRTKGTKKYLIYECVICQEFVSVPMYTDTASVIIPEDIVLSEAIAIIHKYMRTDVRKKVRYLIVGRVITLENGEFMYPESFQRKVDEAAKEKRLEIGKPTAAQNIYEMLKLAHEVDPNFHICYSWRKGGFTLPDSGVSPELEQKWDYANQWMERLIKDIGEVYASCIGYDQDHTCMYIHLDSETTILKTWGVDVSALDALVDNTEGNFHDTENKQPFTVPVEALSGAALRDLKEVQKFVHEESSRMIDERLKDMDEVLASYGFKRSWDVMNAQKYPYSDTYRLVEEVTDGETE